MLVDAAKQGDVEIPYFCYEPKLGQPGRRLPHVPGRDRGHPEAADLVLDAGQGRDGRPHRRPTASTTPRTRSSSSCWSTTRSTARSATRAASARCRTSRSAGARALAAMIEPKRHFEKPLALSPLVAIDRERCILCYRCVRFSQEIAEDYQLIFAERGAHTFVGTHDGHPYVAPFSGNIVELCPVGALTSQPYRFRARPWDIESAGGICTLCPAQCNVTFTVRDERVVRVLARDYNGNEGVDDGWLCDKGRFAYQAIHVDERITAPLVRDGRRAARGLLGARARDRRRRSPSTRAASARWSAARRPTRRASCSQRLMREALDSHDIDSRAPSAQPSPLDAARRRWRRRRCRPRVARHRVRPHRAACSAASRSTTRRSSTCGSARACAATASSCGRQRAAERAGPATPRSSSATRPATSARVRRRARRGARRASRTSARRSTRSRPAARRRRGRRDHLGRADRRARPPRCCCDRAQRLGLARPRRRRAARDPGRRQRPRPARGRRDPRRRPRLRGARRAGPRRRARSPRRWPTAS